MAAWKASSPYSSFAIYIGGPDQFCQVQPNLNSSWITTVVAQGWKLIPIWVGPQAPCTPLGDVTTITPDPALVYAAGQSEANDAADAAAALGVNSGPIYYDMEAYPTGSTCTQVVQTFTSGWLDQLHARGHTAGFYSSLCSGIIDVAADPGSARLDSIWLAAWAYDDQNDPGYATYVPNLFGFTGCGSPLSDAQWSNHQRLRQFRGGHDETWGGVLINIDTNAIDGATYP